MLVLSRRLNQKIVFPDIQTTVQVVAVKPGTIRLGIEAPDHIAVYREELLEKGALPTPAEKNHHLGQDQTAHLLNNLLNVNMVGLALLRRQLALGQIEEMQSTLDKMESNLQSIRQQVEHPGAAPEAAPASARPARRRALVVEDNRNECELLAGLLRLAGLDVYTAGDGSAALDYLNSAGKPDFVLMDMILPRCDGPTTVRAIRGNPAYAGLRIFGVTGAPIEQFGLAEGPCGIDHWFRKPLDPEELLRELDQLSAAETVTD